jgi:Mrp family chromosome partitioning ATPase
LQDVFPIAGPGGRTFGRLRNEVVATRPNGGKVIVVCGASRGPAATMVAANLATAFARAGERAVLVSANMQPGAPISRMFDVTATPGLLDVLSGRIALQDAAQRAPRHPGLRVIPVGGAASAGGLFQADAVRNMLDELKHDADFVVIEAPSMAASPDAQSLAFLADGAIIVAELRRTTHAEVLDAAAQVRRVGCKLLGAVVLSRLDARQTGSVATSVPTQPASRASTVAAAGPADNAATSILTKVSDEPEAPTQFLQRLEIDKDTSSRIDA